MSIIYNFLFAIGLLLASPFYAYRMVRRGNYREGFWQRFGFFSEEIRRRFRENGCVWFRAVSVGEVAEALVVIERLLQHERDLPIALSVTTSTGYQVAKRQAPEGVVVTYYPVDFVWCVSRALRCFNPRLIVLVESDIWPCLMRQATKRRIPVALINSRMSDKSLRGYLKAGLIFRAAFESLALACAPDEDGAARLRRVGVPAKNIRAVGSLKYEVASAVRQKSTLNPAEVLREAGAKPDAPVLIAGSTHPGEEVVLLDLFRELRTQFQDLFLVLAPRHAERGDEVAQLAARKGVACVRRTELMKKTGASTSVNAHPEGAACLLLDTTGELRMFYQVATVIFVGKSLVGHGGQNILEALITSNPVVFGPHMENFRAIAQEVVSAGAAVQVRDEAELGQALKGLLGNSARRTELAARAKAVFDRNLGAAERTAARLLELLETGIREKQS